MELTVLFAGGIFFVSLASLLIISLSLGFAWVNSRFSKLEDRLDSLENRFDRLEAGQAELKELILKQKP